MENIVDDTIVVHCAKCGSDNNIYNIAKKENPVTYMWDSVPVDIAKDIDGMVINCVHCNKRFKLHINNIKFVAITTI